MTVFFGLIIRNMDKLIEFDATIQSRNSIDRILSKIYNACTDYLFIYLFIYLFYLFVYLFIYLFIYLFCIAIELRTCVFCLKCRT